MAKASLTIAIAGEYNNKAIEKAQRDMRNMSVAAAKEMGGVVGSVTNAGDKMVGLGNKTSAFGAKMEATGKKLTSLTVPIAALGAACVKSFADVEEGANAVKTATGLTGEAASDMVSAYKTAAGNVTGSFADVGSATGELNTRLGLTGDALEAATEETMKFAKVNNVDATKAVQSVSSLMNNAGIDASKYGEVLDKLTVAAQQSGISVDTLAESANANAASFEEMGLGTDEAIAMLATFEKTGADTTTILSSMKKGVANWTAEGKDATEEFAKFVSGVQDGSVTAQDAIEIFGSKGGVAMYDAAQKGQLDFQEMFDAISSGSEGALDDVYQDTLTVKDKFDILLKKAEIAASDFGEVILDAAMPMIEDLIEGVKGVAEWFSNLTDEEKQNIIKMGALVAAAGPVITIVGKLASGVGGLIAKIGTGLQNVGAFAGAMKTASVEMKAATGHAATFSQKLSAASEKTGLLTNATSLLKGGLITLGIGAAAALIGVIVGKFMEWKEHTEKVQKATTGLEDAAKKATAAYDAYTPSVEGATEALKLNGVSADDALDSQSKLADKMNDTWKDVNTDAAMIDYYASVIGELGNKGSLTREEYEKLKVAVDEYNSLTGSSVEITDSMTGELSESTEAILNNAEAYKEEARAAAARELLVETTKQMITNELALEDAKTQLNEAEKKQQDFMKQYPGLANPYDAEVNQLREDIAEMEASVESNKKAQDSLMGVMTESPSHFKTFEDALASAGLSLGDLGDVTDEQLGIIEENFDGTLQSIYDTCVEQGMAIPEGLANGIEEKQGLPFDSAEQMVSTMIANMRSFLGISSPSKVAAEIGRNIDAGLGNGINGNASGPINAIGSVVRAIIGGTSNLPSNLRTVGSNSASRLASGLSSGSSSAASAGKNLAVSASNGAAGSVSLFRGDGENAASRYSSGLGMVNMYNQGQAVAVRAREGMGAVDPYNTGWNFSVGFSKGVNGPNIWDVAYSVGKSALSAIKSALGIKSPSKEAQKVGRFFGEGLIVGMQGTEDAVADEADRMGGLLSIDPGGYGGTLYGLQTQGAAPGAGASVVMNVTVNVNAADAEQGRAVGTSLADGLFNEINRRAASELWPVSYSAA